MSDCKQLRLWTRADAEKAGLYEVIGTEVDDAYIAELKKQVLHMDAIEGSGQRS